jgi:hypothetical protein
VIVGETIERNDGESYLKVGLKKLPQDLRRCTSDIAAWVFENVWLAVQRENDNAFFGTGLLKRAR